MDEILQKLNDLDARLRKVEENTAPLSLLNVFDSYSDMGNQFWLVGAIQDLERQGEATRAANGDYLDLRNKEEYEYAKSPSASDFIPSEILRGKMLASSTGVVVYDHLRKEMDAIRSIYFKALNGEINIDDCRKKTEEIVAGRPKKMVYVLRSPEFYTHLDEEDDLMKTIQKYNDERFADEQERWVKLNDPEERKKRAERYEENLKIDNL